METKNLKDYSYYADLYDRHTIEQCRRLETMSKNRAVIDNGDDRFSLREQIGATKAVINLMVYEHSGERYLNREGIIRRWMDDDRQKDTLLASAMPPDSIACRFCGSSMEYTDKHLDSGIDGPDRVLFWFTCERCGKRRALYNNGEEIVRKPHLCTVCHTEVKPTHTLKKNAIVTKYTCVACGHQDTEVLDLTNKETKLTIDKQYLKDKARFCFTKEEGQLYVTQKQNLERFMELAKEQDERKRHKALYDQVAKLKKLSVAELVQALVPPLKQADFGKFELSKPEITRQILAPFTVQDIKVGRSEFESRKALKKQLELVLASTNWRVIPASIDYRLGFLTGRLKAFESEQDLLALVQRGLDTEKA